MENNITKTTSFYFRRMILKLYLENMIMLTNFVKLEPVVLRVTLAWKILNETPKSWRKIVMF